VERVSYCRFSDGDVYLYAHVGGGFECCGCSKGPLVKSVFTEGYKDHPLLGDIETCGECAGEGCGACMMPGSMKLETRSECLEHLQMHKDASDDVPEYAFEILRKELDEEGEKNDPYFEDGYSGPAVIDFASKTIKKAKDFLKELGDKDDNRD
jgi:hypothetical protein